MEGNISSPVRYSYLWTLTDYNADILAASLLISYWIFSSLIWLLIVMIFIIYGERFFLNLKELSDLSVVSLTKNEYGWVVNCL